MEPGGRNLSTHVFLVLLTALLLVLPGCGDAASTAANGGVDAGPAGNDASAPPAPVGIEVTTSTGPIRGDRLDTVLAFRGIPYAAPAVGPLRWRPPEPHPRWTEVREAQQLGAGCPQPDNVAIDLSVTDEDCLTLNVWTPAQNTADALPVFVWIHGGGFFVGGAAEPVYDGSALAASGAVVVTLNYRLGALGFLAHPALSAESAEGTSGNYGIQDQAFALRWVRDNIAAFGGDPGRVALAGQSAGSVSVVVHMATQPRAPTFSRAMAMSGHGYLGRMRRRADAVDGVDSCESLGVAFAQRLLGADATLDAMRAASSADVVAAWEARDVSAGPGGGSLDHICIDGVVIPERPGDLLDAGMGAAVPLITGTVQDESTIFNRGAARVDTLLEWRSWIEARFVSYADTVHDLYGAPATDAEALAAFEALRSDITFACPHRHMARTMQNAGAPVYLYRFSHVSQVGQVSGLGAYHLSELPFLFGVPQAAGGFNAQEQALSQEWMTRTVAFARDRNPTASGAAPWPVHEDAQRYLRLDIPIEAASGLRAAQCDFLDSVVDW